MPGRGWRARARRWAGPNRDLDMEAIRNLAREAAAYEDVPPAPTKTGSHRSGFVDVESHPWDWADADAVIVYATGALDPQAEPWRHQWSPFEADVTPWMSPEEREAAGQPPVVSDQGRAHPDFLEAIEEDRMDAVQASREDRWSAGERAAEALDRLAEPKGVEADAHFQPDIETDWAMEPE